MRLASWNVNGIRAVVRKGLFDPFVRALEPDVICLQETKSQQDQSVPDLPDYTEYWNAAEKKGYSGTAIFTKPTPRAVTGGLPKSLIARHKVIGDAYGDPNVEGRVLTAEFDAFFLVTVYTPNTREDLGRLALRHQQWDPAFLAHTKALAKKKPVVFCGDLNVAHTPDDLANPQSNTGKKGFTDEEREGFQNFLDAGFVDTFRMFHQGNGYYSWWSNFARARERNVGWRIDYFLVSEGLRDRVVAADIHPDIMGSDHCPVSLTLDL
ncbi:MAG: exodeoxyribonuclease III [Acidimicrobiales bacterium]